MLASRQDVLEEFPCLNSRLDNLARARAFLASFGLDERADRLDLALMWVDLFDSRQELRHGVITGDLAPNVLSTYVTMTKQCLAILDRLGLDDQGGEVAAFGQRSKTGKPKKDEPKTDRVKAVLEA